MAFYRSRSSNSNLFSLNYDQILETINDANSNLLSQVNDVLETSQIKLDQEIISNELAESLKDFLKKLRQLQKDLSSARLSDGRPFTDATKKIKNFFSKYERDLKDMDQRLSTKLSSYSRTLLEKAERAVKEEEQKKETEAKELVLGETLEGSPILVKNPSENQEIIEEVTRQTIELPNVTLDWVIESFDENELDFEILRKHFTETAILNALKSHLRIHGPNVLRGVNYTRVVSKKL